MIRALKITLLLFGMTIFLSPVFSQETKKIPDKKKAPSVTIKTVNQVGIVLDQSIVAIEMDAISLQKKRVDLKGIVNFSGTDFLPFKTMVEVRDGECVFLKVGNKYPSFSIKVVLICDGYKKKRITINNFSYYFSDKTYIAVLEKAVIPDEIDTPSICKKCAKRLLPKTMFCPKCGEKQIVNCLFCGKVLSQESKFCRFCGKKTSHGVKLDLDANKVLILSEKAKLEDKLTREEMSLRVIKDKILNLRGKAKELGAESIKKVLWTKAEAIFNRGKICLQTRNYPVARTSFEEAMIQFVDLIKELKKVEGLKILLKEIEKVKLNADKYFAHINSSTKWDKAESLLLEGKAALNKDAISDGYEKLSEGKALFQEALTESKGMKSQVKVDKEKLEARIKVLESFVDFGVIKELDFRQVKSGMAAVFRLFEKDGSFKRTLVEIRVLNKKLDSLQRKAVKTQKKKVVKALGGDNINKSIDMLELLGKLDRGALANQLESLPEKKRTEILKKISKLMHPIIFEELSKTSGSK